MSIIAGGTDALVKFLAQREVEKRQAMLDALKMEDTRRQWGAEQERIRVAQRQNELQEENQKQLRLEAQRRQDEVEQQHRAQRAFTQFQTRMPSKDVGKEAYDLAQEFGYQDISKVPGVSVSRPQLTPESKPGEIAQLPMGIGRTTITPDRFQTEGGSNWQMARAAAAERAQQSERDAAARAAAREDTQAFQASQNEANRTLREGLAAIAASNRQGLSGGQRANYANRLREDFTRDTKDFSTLATSYRDLATTLGTGSAAGDLAAVFRFMKAQDPGSTVREGEQASARNAAGVPDQIRNYYNHLLTGVQLNPNQRADFLNVSKQLYDQGLIGYKKRVEEYTKDAESAEIDPARVIRDYTVQVPDLTGNPAIGTIPQQGGAQTAKPKVKSVTPNRN